ncbi:pregnancy-associated plasma protein-A-domain-containing protein [Massariosphaeria phaeospora]|uniref:Pregnancy-associated plasma protein-A-domain-containing protein n=1 Tax=Massariosphaeria phaeospora TaxID=100035 RepID=A0A7C8IF39_9PLEO|nr:pregnancy-associated plasma protein-A-domain-containing protein [Massariosphaeria phaeospora]
MKFSTLSAYLVSSFVPVSLAIECGNEDFSHDPLNITPSDYRHSLTALRTQDITGVDLYIHVLVANEPDRDRISSDIQGQVNYLNSHFEGWGYTFHPKPINFVINAEWAKDIDVDKNNKMRQLHRGNYQTLNVYMVEGARGGVCSLPNGENKPVEQQLLDFDGCFVPLDVGRSPSIGTVAHEIGHWFGLLHTFQGGCEGDGDYCDDTAPQNAPSRGQLAIPGDLNSCPAQDQCGRGPANVKNFMDYTDCSHEFTPCQGGRMNHAYTNFRNGRRLADGVRVTW